VHLSAVYNAKGFVTDAVMRSPFGTDQCAGMYEVEGPLDEYDVPWGKLFKEHLDSEKFD